MNAPLFSQLPLAPKQLEALDSLGYHAMTPVQEAALPPMLGGKDVIVRAKTGSGKTAAFGIALLQAINPRFFGAQALVLCPTRELADQVASEIRRLASRMPNLKVVTLCGGKPFGPQRDSLQHGAHVVVGTPGRILDHLEKHTLNLEGLSCLVLDEADRMLDMGFSAAMKSIVAKTPKKRQTLLFSATYPEDIQAISRSVQRNPTSITVDSAPAHEDSTIEQLFIEVQPHEKRTALLAVFEHYQPENALVFCNTRKQCAEVAAFLGAYDITAMALHGDLDQRQRDQVMIQFANGSCPVLVATDVAARGLDIKSLALVLNYEVPRDAEVFVHRVGRTGRAGETGKALSLVTPAEAPRLRAIEAYQGRPCVFDVVESLDRDANYSLRSHWVTVQFDAGRKQKIRPGDVLGVLTGDAGLAGNQVGKINIQDNASYVAIERDALRQAMNYLKNGKLKGRSVRARRLKVG